MAPTAAIATSVSFRIRAVRAMMVRKGVIRMAVPPVAFSGKDDLYDGKDEIENYFECRHKEVDLSVVRP